MGRKQRKKAPKQPRGGTAANRSNGGSSASGGGGKGAFSSWRDIPAFHSKENEGDGDVGGMHQRYKRATESVRDFLRTAVPRSATIKLESVNDLSKAAEHIFNRAVSSAVSSAAGADNEAESKIGSSDSPVEIPMSVLKELDVSISLREKASEAYGSKGEADEGHRYMLDTLKHVRTNLGMARKIRRISKRMREKNVVVAPVAPPGDNSAINSVIGGKFSALVASDEDEEEEREAPDNLIDEEMVRRGNFPRVSAPREPQRAASLSIEEDLIKGSDRFQAILFLQSLENFMGSVDQHYGFLKSVLSEDPSFPKTKPIMQLLMECTVAANNATATVRSMEAALAIDYEHLGSFYNILAVVFLPNFIAKIEEQISDSIRKEKPSLVKKFVGEVVETCFHNRGQERHPAIIRKFVKASKLQSAVVEKNVQQICMATSMEAQLECERSSNSQLTAIFNQVCGATPHSWFKSSSHYLGDDRSIINTQRIVQTVFDIVRPGTKLVPKGNFFGAMWNESACLANRIRGDLDELLGSDILPELIEVCKYAPVHRLPGHKELLPLLDLLAEQTKNWERPVPISLTFGLHAVLTSVFVLQGKGDVSRLASAAKQSWETLFGQLEEQSRTKIPQPPSFFHNLKMFKQMVSLAQPVGKAGTSTSESNAFWNPVCAGAFLLFGTYICSIGLGSATVDSFAQLRITLHLYNALKVRDLIADDLKLLSNLDKAFENTKAVWVTGKYPAQGELTKSFLLAWGHSADVAASRMECERRLHSSDDTDKPPIQLDTITTRELNEIKPEEYSLSYRRLVMHEFSDAVDDYSVRNATEKQRKEFGEFFDFVSRVNMIRDAMDDDEDNVIPFNFVQVGGVLNLFTCELSKEMGWGALIKHVVTACPDEIRKGRGPDGRRLTGFYTSDDNLERMAVTDLVATLLGEADFSTESHPQELDKAAAFMKKFFTEDRKDQCMFLAEPSESHKIASPNPLLGDYPYGRTGKTTADPLRAFWQLKYSKAGKPLPRLIKPGKRTPFVCSQSGEAESPYAGSVPVHGNLLPRLANGRYRHIASYSLEELIDLGWDGAKYVPKSVPKLKGVWIPFVLGYDSDPEDTYDPVDVAAGRRAGTIGLAREEIGLYMDVPSSGLVQLKK